MYKISEHKEAIITNLVSNIIWYLLTILIANVLLWIPLIKGIYKSIKTNTYNIPIYAFILIGISVLFMFILMVSAIHFAIKSHRNQGTKQEAKDEDEITTDLIFNKLEIELYFKDRKNIFSYLTYDCQANKVGYHEFEKSILWTGNKYNYTKILESNGNYSLTDSTRKASPYNYIINFNKSFSIGENIYFKLETSVNDDDLSMTPVFSHMLKQQTTQLVIHLTVPRDLVKNIRAAVYKDISRTLKVPNDIKLIQNNVGDLIQFSYTIDNPTLLNNYCIEWDFK